MQLAIYLRSLDSASPVGSNGFSTWLIKRLESSFDRRYPV